MSKVGSLEDQGEKKDGVGGCLMNLVRSSRLFH